MQLEGLQIGSYRLLRLIGGGGMGDVYLAEDLRVNRQVAIKVIQTRATSNSETGTTQDTVRLFRREVKAIANLDHPYILPFFDCGGGSINGMNITYMVMPFRKEGSLLAWLRQHSPSKALSPQYVAHFLHQAADALQYAHDQQVIHRDVKPSNFLVRNNKENPAGPDLLLADFGLAKFSTITSAVSRGNYGTPIYMAPEHWDGQPVPATDQYALAVMAYELLTGRPPFLGNQQQVMYQHLEVQPQPPSKFNPHIPVGIDAVLLRALAKRPADRYPSITAFAHAFEQALPGVEPPDRGQAAQQPSPGVEHSDREQAIQQPQPGTEDAHIGSESTSIPIPIPTSGKMPITRGRDRSMSRVTPLMGLVLLFITLGGAMLSYTSIHRATKAPARVTVTARASAVVTVQTPVATATVPPLQSLYPPHKGTLALYDLLQDNYKGYNWDEVTDSFGSCTFANGAYHVTVSKQQSLYPCTEESANFSNFVYQVQMTIVAGDYGGIVFRVDSTHAKFYYFRIGKDGSYKLYLDQGNGGTNNQVLKSGSSLSIKTGLQQSNVIAVVASGSDLDLYVNHQHIAYVSDSTFSQGQLGVCAEDAGNPTAVVYSDALVWRL